MNQHTITLLTPTGTHSIQCSPELSVLDAAAAQGLILPAVCRGGACSACVGRMVSGEPPDQSEQSYLSQTDLEEGFVLLCVAYAGGDCTLETHRAEEYVGKLAASQGL